MSKKVIDQENDYPIEIEIQKDGENDGVFMTQSTSSFDYDNIWINQENATTVAKAICPEYQKVIDQNAKLVEALEGLVNSNPIHEGYHEKKLKAIEALQNTKNIEG